MASEKIIQLAKKLNELAKRGVDGEKENAKVMLNNLMYRHNISIDEIETEQTKVYDFLLGNLKTKKKLFDQIAVKVCGWDVKFYHGSSKTRQGVKCTASQAVEIQAMFDFYLDRYAEDEKIFLNAFIQKNKLFAQGENPFRKRIGEDKRTAEEIRKEREENWRIANMSEGLSKHDFLKQIGN